MSSTYSSTLRIELIGDGDQSGIWGQTTNNNLGALIEQAITGVVTITMVDANYTLTAYNGVVDESRNAVIIATGTNSAQRNIIAPLVEKVYTIKNSTTGGYPIQIIGASGAGVVIANGTTTSVYCDGSDFYPLQTGSAGNQVINGNLAVTGTASIAGALSGSTASFSGAISAVSPAFTGTPTAPTAPTGTSTTQIATTAFVQNFAGTLGTMSTQNANNVAITGGTIGAAVSWGAMPAGTLVMFAQAAAPTGWTQVTSDSANNRMLRVVNSTGAGVGGSASPILNNVVPAHTHNFSTGTESQAHTHSGGTSYVSNDHAHYTAGYTGGQTADHNHQTRTPSAYSAGEEAVYWVDTGGNDTNEYHSFQGYTSRGTSNDHAHYFGAWSGGQNANHTHTFTSGTESANHTHSGTTDNGSSQTNWAPRYIDMIMCSKN